MADEKRIVQFEPATQLEIDDWIAVDSPNVGTRKIQKSMFMADEIASLQTLSTAMGSAQTDIGNLQTRAGMSQNLNFGDNLTDGVNTLSVLLGAEPYVNTRTYAVGEYCIYEKQLYKCTTAVSSAEDFDSDKWTLTNVKTELTELNSSKADKSFLPSLMKTKVFTQQITVTANSSFGANIDASFTEYTFIGVAGLMLTSGAALVSRLNATQYNTANNLYVSGYAIGSGTITVRVVAFYYIS